MYIITGIWAPIDLRAASRNLYLYIGCYRHSLSTRCPQVEFNIFMYIITGIHRLRAALLRVRAIYRPNIDLVVFKSDVSRAYRCKPLAPLWQIFQIITIDGMHRVDRCNNFGNRGAEGSWGTFFALVMWIAIYVRFIIDLFAYVDDVYSWDFADRMTLYTRYNKPFPDKQASLEPWDELGIPHEAHKQVFGKTLTIFRFVVHPNAMTITMPPDSRQELITAVRAFARTGQHRPLRNFQQLVGWMNWSINTNPRLLPGLFAMYTKMSGKSIATQSVWVSTAPSRELNWFVDKLDASTGIHIITSREWGPESADFVLYTDACPMGLGFWSPALLQGFQYLTIEGQQAGIFFLEALAVLSALYWTLKHSGSSPQRILIYTDNTNTVDMFNTLRADAVHNPILLTAIDLLTLHDAELRVHHISGHDNIVANALSRWDNATAVLHAPGIAISSFIPPRLTMGASSS